MPNRWTHSVALLLLVALAWLVGGCGPSPSPGAGVEEVAAAAPSEGGTCFVGLRSDVPTFFAWKPMYSHQREVIDLVFLPLARYDRATAEFLPVLAESWAEAEEGRELEVRLRTDARWEDGRTVSAADVVFTHEMAASEEIDGTYLLEKQKIASVEALDERTVRFRFHRAYPESLRDAVLGPIYPAHLLEGTPATELSRSPFSEQPVGCGPFRVGRRVRGQVLELEASETYFGGRPWLDRIVFQIASKPEARTNLLEEGSVDLLRMAGPLPFQRLESLPRFQGFIVPAQSQLQLVWNVTTPTLADRRVRRALALAIDRQQLLALAQQGRGSVCHGPIPPWSWAFVPDLPYLPLDLVAARALLDEAGWRDGNGDGLRERDDTPLALRLEFSASPYFRQTAELIRSDLRKIGVDVALQELEGEVFLTDLREGRGQAYLVADPVKDRLDLCWRVHSRFIDEDGWNYPRYRNEELDRACDAVEQARSREEALPALRRAQEIVLEDQPMTFLVYRPALHVMSRRIHGVEIGPAGLFATASSWWIPPEKRRP
jgi:peptide/nickel transport system substrate-binding protein